MFTSTVDPRETVQPFKDYTLREQEIARHQRQARSKSAGAALSPTGCLPKRLRGQAFVLVRRLQKLHSRCCYNELLQHYCPPGVTYLPFDCNPIANNAQKSLRQATSFSPAKTSRSRGADPSGKDDLSSSISLSNSERTNLEVSMVEYATPASDVSAFCRAVLARLIPHGFWGVGKEGEENQRVIMRQIDCFIHLRKFESLSLHLVSQRLKVPLTRSILEAPAHVPYS